MSRDIAESIQSLTQPGQTIDRAPLPSRGGAPRAVSSAVQSMSAKGSNDFVPGGPVTIYSTDGLFSMSFPATLTTEILAAKYKIGVLEVT